VWEEALAQARDMLQSWTDQGASGTRDTVMNTATLTLHVLTGAGFGISYPYDKGVQSPPPGYDLSYRDALLTVLQSVVVLAIIPKSLMDFRFSPAKLRRVSKATREFQMYMDEMLNTVRNSDSKQRAQSKNLLNALVQASEEARQSSLDGLTTLIRNGLTDKEIFGNIFIYNLAGYETTANTIATGIVLLAAYPEWQEWLAEEIDLVFVNDESSPKWKYEEAFPKLNRCLAVMVRNLHPERIMLNTSELTAS
jgi:cytochrome P450